MLLGASSTLRQRLAISNDAFVVGAVGNIRRPKAYEDLLHAADTIAKQDPRVCFLVAGEPRAPLSDELDAIHKRLGLGDRFRFLGLVDDIPDFLAALDLFVISSRKEGFSIASVEAMAAGLPVVATRSGGPESIVKDNVSGYLVPPNDPDSLAVAIGELVDDDDTRHQFGAAGISRARGLFSLESCVAAYEKLILDLTRR